MTDDRATLNLFDVTTRREYTPEYIAKWPSTKSHESTYPEWGATANEVRERVEKRNAPGQYPYFDAMYRDVLVSVERVTDNELAKRRNKLQDLSFTRPCCELAVLSPCVCSYKTTCPVHGGICHGSHD